MKKLTSTLMMVLALGASAEGVGAPSCKELKAVRQYLAAKDYAKAFASLEALEAQKNLTGTTCDNSSSQFTSYINWNYSYNRVIAELYHKGLGTKQNLDKAIQIYEEIGDEYMAEFIRRAEKQGKTPTYLKRMAEQGDPGSIDVMVLLATWYIAYEENNFPLAIIEAADVTKDPFIYPIKTRQDDERGKKALYWLERAAEANHAEAQLLLGELLSEGKNKTIAFKWYKKAADQGDAIGQHRVARSYDWGSGTIKDKELALKYARLACENEYERGCLLYNRIKYRTP